MPIYNYDDDTDGQLTIEDYMSPVNSMVAVADIFARAKKQMNVYEYKTFIFALAQIRWKEEVKSNLVYLDKKELADYCGVHTDADHLSVDLQEKIQDLPRNSFIKISNKDLGLFDSGCFVNRITMLKNRVRIKFDDEYLKLFTSLQNGEYITLWADDFLHMDNSENGVRAMTLYEDLRQHSDTRITNVRGYGVKALKELWGIPKDGKGSYVRKDGHFNRPMFEKYCLEPVLENLSKCKMITVLMQQDGKLYEKVKRGNKVRGYNIYWVVSNRPAVATATEMIEIQDRVDRNPQVLKIAKDILAGEKIKKNKPKKNSFNDFEQRDCDYSDLEMY